MKFLRTLGQIFRAVTSPGNRTTVSKSTGKRAPSNQPPTGRPGNQRTGGQVTRPTAATVTDEVSPGQTGPSATTEVNPGDIGNVRMSYQPGRDGNPDPGEIVWTWVPFEENDGRGKDRPVLVVAAEQLGTFLAVQLTSKHHNGEAEFIAVGPGSWDAENRPSWVNIDRVFRVHSAGMRREAAALPKDKFELVSSRLKARYRWN